jgi:hypothetical protein
MGQVNYKNKIKNSMRQINEVVISRDLWFILTILYTRQTNTKQS